MGGGSERIDEYKWKAAEGETVREDDRRNEGVCLQRGVGEGIPHRRYKKEAASKFRAFKRQQFHLTWSRWLGSPVLRSRYISSSGALYWVGFIHTSVKGKVWGCRPWGSGPPCPSFQTPCGTHAAPLPRRNDKEGLPSPILSIHSRLFFIVYSVEWRIFQNLCYDFEFCVVKLICTKFKGKRTCVMQGDLIKTGASIV